MFGGASTWPMLLAAAAFMLAGRAALGPFVQAQTNPITVEKALTGNVSSEWDVSGAGDPSIQGFPTDISVDKGQPVNFKINSNSNYTIDIYRLGYYGGAGARKVASIPPSLAVLLTSSIPRRRTARRRGTRLA